jgi:hypothetical protein
MATKLTALDFVTRVRRGLGNPPTDEIEAALLLQSVNLVYHRICSRYSHPELTASMSLTCTANDATLDLNVLSKNIKSIGTPINTTIASPMIYIDGDQMDYRNRGQNQAGHPYYYTLVPGSTAGYLAIELWPVPSSTDAVTVPYEQMPADLVLSPAETSTILAPAWDEAIVSGAISDAAAILGDFQRAKFYDEKFEKACNEAYPGTLRSSEAPWRILALRP